MRKSTRQAQKAVKARLSGTISSNSPKNKKIVFGDDHDDEDNSVIDNEMQMQNNDSDEEVGDGNIANKDGKGENNDDSGSEEEEDDAVEEVKGTAARESTQRLREEERKVAKESIVKKKRKKKNEDAAAAAENEVFSESEGEEEDLLTEDFFKMVDSERANQLQNSKREKKYKKIQQKKRLGKHTTFVVEDEYKMTNAPHKMNQNIEVVAIGGGGGGGGSSENNASTTTVDEDRQLLLSATLGSSPSKAAISFARGSMSCGTSKERGSESRKRKSKTDEAWKRSRKLNKLGIGSRPGRAAALFVCKR
ncbi:hypothetical protein ACHAXR_009660 [Thalassiosira sp. AJA248-18]